MNLSALSVNMMLNITERWLADPEFRDRLLAGGLLGAGVLEQLEHTHAPLADLQHKRDAAHAKVKALIDLATTLDGLHDRKARSLYHSIIALIEGADDEGEIVQYRELERFLFPTGLRVIRLPYIEEGGSAVALDRAVGPELRAKLEALKIGPRTLRDLFEAWMEAGHKLGEVVRRRSELKAALGSEGSAGGEIDLRAGRSVWMQAIRGLLWAIESVPALATLNEPVRATLSEAISLVLRRRAGAGAGEIDGIDGAEEIEAPADPDATEPLADLEQANEDPDDDPE